MRKGFQGLALLPLFMWTCEEKTTHSGRCPRVTEGHSNGFEAVLIREAFFVVAELFGQSNQSPNPVWIVISGKFEWFLKKTITKEKHLYRLLCMK